MFAVVGLTNAEVAAGPNTHPHMRLIAALDEQVRQHAFDAGPAERALVHGFDATDVEELNQIRDEYLDQGEFAMFSFYNNVARRACADFGIEIRVLGNVNEVPHPGVVLVDRPYVHP